jgi:hypothetical protein
MNRYPAKQKGRPPHPGRHRNAATNARRGQYRCFVAAPRGRRRSQRARRPIHAEQPTEDVTRRDLSGPWPRSPAASEQRQRHLALPRHGRDLLHGLVHPGRDVRRQAIASPSSGSAPIDDVTVACRPGCFGQLANPLIDVALRNATVDEGRSKGAARNRSLNCQSARKFDPSSASNFDPFARRGLLVAPASELAGVVETMRARVA